MAAFLLVALALEYSSPCSIPLDDSNSSPKISERKKSKASKSGASLILYMDVSENSGTPQSSILIGFSIINHPFWGTSVFGNTHISKCVCACVCVCDTNQLHWIYLWDPPGCGGTSSPQSDDMKNMKLGDWESHPKPIASRVFGGLDPIN